MVYASEAKHRVDNTMHSISSKQSGSVTSRAANCFWWSQKPWPVTQLPASNNFPWSSYRMGRERFTLTLRPWKLLHPLLLVCSGVCILNLAHSLSFTGPARGCQAFYKGSTWP